MTRRRFYFALLTVAGIATGPLVGCNGGGDELPRQAVSGTVTFDGKPLESGSIQFQPDDAGAAKGAISGGGAVITNGHYEITQEKGLTPGSYKVIVSSHGDAPVDESAPPGEVTAPSKTLAELIPSHYNAQTTLTAQVVGDKANTVNFDLKK